MAIWQILLILVGIILTGCIVGAVIGKILVKRAKSNRPPVLSFRQRMVFLSCIAVGIGCILIGVYLDRKAPGDMDSGMMGDMPGMYEKEMAGRIEPGVMEEFDANAEIDDNAEEKSMLEDEHGVAEKTDDAEEPIADDTEEPAVG